MSYCLDTWEANDIPAVLSFRLPQSLIGFVVVVCCQPLGQERRLESFNANETESNDIHISSGRWKGRQKHDSRSWLWWYLPFSIIVWSATVSLFGHRLIKNVYLQKTKQYASFCYEGRLTSFHTQYRVSSFWKTNKCWYRPIYVSYIPRTERVDI